MVPFWPLLVFAVANAVTVVRLQLYFEQTHTLTLNNSLEYILQFMPRGDEGSWPSRLLLESNGGDAAHPLLLTARQRTGAVTWQLPYLVGDHLLYRMERTLCSNPRADSADDGPCVNATIDEGFSLHASPRILHYKFTAGQSRVRLVAESDDDTCATISVQDLLCPVPQTLAEVSIGGMRMTMQRSAGAYVSRNRFPDGFLVVALVRDGDEACTGEAAAGSDWLWNDALPLLLRDAADAQTSMRNKTLAIIIKPALSRTQYAWAAVATLLVFLLFYGAFLATVVAQRWTPWARLVGPKAVFAETASAGDGRTPDDVHPPVASLTIETEAPETTSTHPPVTSATIDTQPPMTSAITDTHSPMTSTTDTHAPETSDTTNTHPPVTSATIDTHPPMTSAITDTHSPMTSTTDTHAPDTSDTTNTHPPVTSATIDTHPPMTSATTDTHATGTSATTDTHAPVTSATTDPHASKTSANGPQKNARRNRRNSTATFDSCDMSDNSDSDHNSIAPYGLPASGALKVAVLARRRDRVLRVRSDRYLYTLYTVAIFYALPVVQIVAGFQLLLNISGTLDTCYYNFLCAHPAGALSDFNHVYSNLGYVLLGGLFMLQVRRRRSARRARPRDENYGIPPHYGLLSTLGAGCMIVGVLSASYHVCPNKLNFQFDMAFMYVLGVVSMVKIYQSRHPDVNARAHSTFGVLAVLMALVVWGVLGGGPLFWGVFTVLHVFTFLLLSLRIYYMGQFRLEKETLQRAARELAAVPKRGVRPLYTARLVMLLIVNAVNWLFALYGLFVLPADFASHLLSVLLCNTLLYMVFYVSMKLLHGERPRWYSWLYTAGAAAAWVPALYFFVSGSSSWSTTPAQSRHLNHECRLLNFYDSHDLWHLLSAIALYLSFNAMFTWDDGLTAVRRSDIPVF